MMVDRDSVPPVIASETISLLFRFEGVDTPSCASSSSRLRPIPNALSHLENCRASTSIFVLLNELYSKQLRANGGCLGAKNR